MLNNTINFQISSYAQQIKIKTSTKTICSQNQNVHDPQTSPETIVQNYLNLIYRSEVFRIKQNSGCKYLSPKVNRSAVGWIQTNCWIKNFDLDTTLLSIILYYAYCAQRPVDKTKLELILSTCIFFAKKYVSRPPMSIDIAIDMISGKFSKTEIFQIETELFEIIQFDFYFENVAHLLASKHLSEEEEFKVKFLMEILLLKDHKVLFSIEILDFLIKIAHNSSFVGNFFGTPELLKCKQSEMLINKYKSHFGADTFVEQLLNSILRNRQEAERHSV